MAASGSKTSKMAASGIKNPDISNSDGNHYQMYSNSEKSFNIIVSGVEESPWGISRATRPESDLDNIIMVTLELTIQLDLTPSEITSGWEV